MKRFKDFGISVYHSLFIIYHCDEYVDECEFDLSPILTSVQHHRVSVPVTVCHLTLFYQLLILHLL